MPERSWFALGVYALAACTFAACEPQSVKIPAAHHDAGSGSHHPNKDAGASMSHPKPDAGPPPTMHEDAATSQLPPFPDSVCALHVGAECDGREDCGNGEVCCGKVSDTAPTYESISCQTQCEQPTGFELCHPGDTCKNGATCRHSVLIPYDFIGVCVGLLANDPTLIGAPTPHAVPCGDQSCRVGVEKCCLRAKLEFFGTALTPRPLYCAPLDAKCDCDDESPPPPEGGGDDDAG